MKKRVFMIVNVTIDTLLIFAFVVMGKDMVEPHGWQQGLQAAIPVAVVIVLGCITRTMSFNGGRYTELVGSLTYVLPVFAFPITIGCMLHDVKLAADPFIGAAVCSLVALVAATTTDRILATKSGN